MMDMLLAKASLKEYSRLKDDQGKTVLHRAAWACSTTIVEDWVDKELDTTARDNDRNLALHLAARMGFVPVVELLLDIDESLVSVKGCNGLTPLHYATMNGHDAVV